MLKLENFILMIKVQVSARNEIYHNVEHMQRI